HKEHGPQYQHRLIFRTSQLVTLRGSILEDATPTTAKPGTVRGLPLRDVLEYVVPELNIHCLRLAFSTPKVTEQLLKLDEQGLCRRIKVGILYCKAGQSSEEEMYNNEEAGPALDEFLTLLGEKVSLKSFTKYAAQLDTKTDSTGTHSLYTTYQDYEIMFHVSTMLPYTPNNRQQLLRKRHIGNDIVTIIFQEPGALPFTPQNIRSHFQHVFIIVRAHHPCTDSVSYSVAVTRSKDVPPFGPPLPPSGVTFRRSDLFRAFLLAKAINAENAAHKSHKFRTMATRTRQEYLRDLAENYVTNTPLDTAGKFNLISLASKKKEKCKARPSAELESAGAVSWRVSALDFGRGAEIPCVLGISNEFVVLMDLGAKEVVFNCFTGDVIGWSAEGPALRIYHGRGDLVSVRAGVPGADGDRGAEEVREIVQRLKVTTPGCATVDMTLRRNGLGQLGFHVHPDGSVAEVEEYGFAWQAGLRRGSRLLEVCKVAAVALSHEQMIDLLRTSVTVTVGIVPPHDDGTPRRWVRGWGQVNVFGQPRLRASLRDLRSPRRLPKSSIEDDLKRLILMDNSCPEPDPAPVRHKFPKIHPTPRPLQRTLSDESLCGGRRDPPGFNPNSPSRDFPETFPGGFPSSTLPGRRGPQDKKGEFRGFLEGLTEFLGIAGIWAPPGPVARLDPGLIPLPDTAGLEWATLVNAAKAYEGKAGESQNGGGKIGSLPAPLDLPGKVSQLEAMLKQLHSDLEKEKQDKVFLQAEVANLRQNNRRLQQESSSAARQLRRFARIFSGAGAPDES
uniref:Signal induced proliferation associated 1 like 3 n=1 Tax=Malurus cyaneus samueli TaxID=2593467 RepID=A0A8C5TLS6_9PASS